MRCDDAGFDTQNGIIAISRILLIVMIARPLPTIALLLFATVLPACRCPSRHCVPCTPGAPCDCELAEAETVTPDVSAVYDSIVRLPSPTKEYCLLAEHDCQCNAALSDANAQMVLLERHLAIVLAECETPAVDRNLSLFRDLLSLYAVDKRNLAAATALEAFYRLAELEAGVQSLEKLLIETEVAATRAADLTDQDLVASLDPSELERQVLDLKDKRATLDLNRLELNGQLRRLLNCPLDSTQFFWPKTSWVIDVEPYDVEAEVAVGIASRSDLRALRLTICHLENDTRPVARGVLAAFDGALGTAKVQDGWLHRLRCIVCSRQEVPVRCRQLRILLRDSERGAEVEIRRAAYTVQSQYERLAIAQSKVVSWRRRVAELEAKREVTDVTTFDLTRAKNSLFQSATDVNHHIVELKIARMKLRQAQGLLPVECGLGGRVCLEGCPCAGECRLDCGHCR